MTLPFFKGNLSFGTETYIPARLLAGVLPQTLLETHRFWQDEDDQLRGYPIHEHPRTHEEAGAGDLAEDGNDKDADGGATKGEARGEAMLIFVNLAAGGHVATHGSKWASVRAPPDMNLPPGRAVVVRLRLSRLAAGAQKSPAKLTKLH